MDHLECPSVEVWNERRAWFENLAEQDGGFLLGEQALAIVADLQAAYCAGAWVAALILAFSGG